MLLRIRDAVDRRLRREQAGFRRGRGTNEQIFILRNIIEQCLEWNPALYLVFVDYEKAFDSIESLVKAFYQGNKAAVIHGEGMSDWFEIRVWS